MKESSTTKRPLGVLVKASLRLKKKLWQTDKKAAIARLLLIIIQIVAALLATLYASRTIGLIASKLGGDATITQRQIIATILIAGLFGIVDQVAWRLLEYFERMSYFAISLWTQTEFRRKVASLDTEYLEDREFNKLINKLDQKADWATSAYCSSIVYMIHGSLRILTIAAVLVRLSWWLLPVLIIASIPSLIAQLRASKLEWGIWGEEGDAYHRYYGTLSLFKNQQSLQEIKILGLSSYLLDDVAAKLLKKFFSKQKTVIKKFLRPSILARLSETMVLVLTQLWMLSRLLAGHMTLTTFTFFIGVIAQFNSAVTLLIGSFERAYEQALYVDDFFTLLDTKSRLSYVENAEKLNKELLPKIEFRDVTFRYPGSQHTVFKNLNVIIEPGQDVAFVGENGAGKSTFIKLLLRFYDPEEGAIYINGIDIRTLDLDSWYKHISVLFQTFNKYPFEISENIRLGQSRKNSPQLVKEAAQMAGVEDFANELPYGLETLLDPSFEKGIEPSGGQWQRVALARAFYRSANVLILDEPTAAIDAIAEYKIFNAIFEHQEKRTTIIISHRFSTVRNADRIIVLDKGKVMEDGSHNELMKLEGLYKEMFMKQAEGYL